MDFFFYICHQFFFFVCFFFCKFYILAIYPPGGVPARMTVRVKLTAVARWGGVLWASQARKPHAAAAAVAAAAV